MVLDTSRFRRTPRPVKAPGGGGAPIPTAPATIPGGPPDPRGPTPVPIQQPPTPLPQQQQIPPGYGVDGYGRLVPIQQYQGYGYPIQPAPQAPVQQDPDFMFPEEEPVKKKQKKGGLFSRGKTETKERQSSGGGLGSALVIFTVLLLSIAGIGVSVYLAFLMGSEPAENLKNLRWMLLVIGGQYLLMGFGFMSLWSARPRQTPSN